MSSGLSFAGIDRLERTVLYKGITGKPYAFSINIPNALHIAHGATLQLMGGGGGGGDSPLNNTAAASTNLFTVVGVSPASIAPEAKPSTTASSSSSAAATVGIAPAVGASALPCDLWLHEHGAACPTLLKALRSTEDLFRRGFAALDKAPPSSTPFLGPLGVSYYFQTPNKVLSGTFGVTQGERYYLKALGANVRIIGELFGVLWVAKDDEPNIAVPLPGCSNEDALHGLYGLCEPVPSADLAALRPTEGLSFLASSSSSSAPPLVSTPRRATNTPRRATGDGKNAMVVDAAAGTALCTGPMGARLRLDITPKALAVFGLIHNQKMVCRLGLEAGRLCRAIGAVGGALYVLFEGDSRVTCVRSCANAEDVKKHFGGGAGASPSSSAASASARAVPSATTTPGRSTTSQHLSAPPSASVQGGGVQGGGGASDITSPASPRMADKAKRFWTAFGRFEFDTSDFCCAAYGFYHGQVVRATLGPTKGKLFTVVGVRLGNLWVLEEGKYRATPLVHCSDKAGIKAMYGLAATGAVKDLRPFYEHAVEPPPTPMHTPRFRLASASPPSAQRGGGVASPSSALSSGRLEGSPRSEPSVPNNTNNNNDISVTRQLSSQLSPRGGSCGPAGSLADFELSPPSQRGSMSPQLVSSTNANSSGLAASPPPPPQNGSNNNTAPVAMPALNFGAVQRDNAPLPTVVGSSSSSGGGSGAVDRDTIALASRSSSSAANNNNTNNNTTIERSEVMVRGLAASPAAVALAQPSAREYLKAWALMRMGVRTADATASLLFHRYYMEDTIRRVSEAFSKLPRARQVWATEGRAPDFYSAATQDILQFLLERPSISAY